MPNLHVAWKILKEMHKYEECSVRNTLKYTFTYIHSQITYALTKGYHHPKRIFL